MTITLAGYQTRDLIYEGTRTLVYRGVKTDGSKSVVLKQLRKEYPTFNELVQFRHQYVLTKNLDLPGIVKSIALEKSGNGYVLVMEDVGGVSLSEYADRPLAIEEFLQVAIALSQILENLHQKRIIHKDIKPANILINPETKEIYLIDFSISSLLPRETQEIQNPNILEGTLAYISPEQTGRMNRSIDYRSDFYSLGVTFYQLLTGELPFKSDDPMELVHCHITKMPAALGKRQEAGGNREEEIPGVLSDIVFKLMAKTAEERYQSARGIKQDLEKCWQQWQETGSIAFFELGERDISDRFLIPEKLYGREQEVQTLLDAFNRVSQGNGEFLLVAGYSGVGKTAVVNEVHKPIVRQRGYFIKGKFDQFNRNIPFSAFVIAFRDLMGQLLGESDTQLQEWKAKILEALGENGQVLIDVIPELEAIVGEQPPVPELSGTAAQDRFNLLFEKFIAVFTTTEHPLTLFLDDLQWADSASLNLLKVLMGDSRTGYLLLLGAYRDNEVFPAHPLMLCLGELEKQRTTISTITLAPLSVDCINRLVAQTLNCTMEVASPLTDLVYQKTKGNPFFTTQFLTGLHEDGLIALNQNLGAWECDLVKVREAALTDDVVEFMVGRLHKLPEASQKVMKLAACIGNQFDLETLAIICENPSEEVAADLWSALREGLILPQSEAYKFFQGWERDDEGAEGISVGYRFLHDRVQQAAYSLIAKGERKNTHLKIGKLLFDKTPSDRQENKLFDIVNHLNMAIELVNDRSDRDALVLLNLRASQKAKTSIAYAAASSYLATCMDLLPENAWEIQYDLTLNIYQERAEIEYLQGEFSASKKYIEDSIALAKKDVEKAKAYQLLVVLYTTMADFEAAIQAGRTGLKTLGIDFPQQSLAEAIEQERASAEKTLGQREISELARLPDIENPQIEIAVNILLCMQPPGYFSNMNIWALAVLKCAHLLMQYGNTVEAAPAYVQYGLYSIVSLEQYLTGYKFGCIGIELSERYFNKSHQSMTYCVFGLCLNYWVKPAKISQELSLKGYSSGLERGNLQWAGYNLAYRLFVLIFLGDCIQDIFQEISICLAFGEKRNDRVVIDMAISCQKLLSKLDDLEFTETDTETEAKRQEESNFIATSTCVPQYLILKSQILYLQNRPQEALEAAIEAKNVIEAIQGNISVVEHNFYYSLSLLALHRPGSIEVDSSDWQQAIANQERMKLWADNCPENFLHRYLIVAAEMARVSGQTLEAIELYDRAISEAKSNEYIQNEALANELAAKFYLDWGKEKVAAGYMQDAYYCYARWGAKAKVGDLEKRYPQLLDLILKGQQLGLIPSTTMATIAQATLSATSTGTREILDLTTLMKASRTLSEKIELEGAIANLMQVVKENAGAETAALMLFEEEVLMLSALACGEEAPQIDPIPVETSKLVPLSVVNKVKRTQKAIALDNASNESAYAGDAYIASSQPQSILCLPLVDRGKLIGILYLENNRVAGAFTGDRVEVLNLLCSQAAISLENARLYQQSLNYAQKLEQTQLQLVQSEKMASIGELAAGVAHEINNPVGFISGNLDYASDYFQDLMELLELYQIELPSPSETILKKIEESELDYLIEDLPQTIHSMKEGIDRITEISKSMRTFSRGDTATKVPFNIHDGIDSTLLILKHRLKANENRPEIEIVKNYGNLPEVNCYPGQLNQVFMNLIANAIDAFDEGNIGHTFNEIKAAPNRITITTEIDSEKQVALVKIKDNGIGMSEEVKAKVFEHLFTTKGVGKGTGLGLSISRQIVEEKHGGTLTCNSEVGKGTEFAIALPI